MDTNSPDTLLAKSELEPRELCADLKKAEEIKAESENPSPKEKTPEQVEKRTPGPEQKLSQVKAVDSSSESDDDYDKYLEQLEQEHSFIEDSPDKK